MPSTGEGFGVAFLEAMASGTPALGLDVAGARDALADGRLGTAVPEADLLSAIDRALAAPRPNPYALAGAARALFGRERFVAAAFAALSRLAEADGNHLNLATYAHGAYRELAVRQCSADCWKAMK